MHGSQGSRKSRVTMHTAALLGLGPFAADDRGAGASPLAM